MFKKILNALTPKTQREMEEAYYAKATDLADLERRMRAVQNNQLRGWV